MLVLPSPNDQFQLVGILVEVSVNWTANGAVPEVTLEVKLDTGAIVAALILINVSSVEILEPALLLAFRTIE